MPSIHKVATDIGQYRDVSIMPQLAVAAATAAKRGEIQAEQANELFHTYKTKGGKVWVDTETTSYRVQCSKLRQIIKAKDPALLDEVTKVYQTLGPSERKGSLYDAMVEASRFLVTRGTRPGARNLRQLIKKK